MYLGIYTREEKCPVGRGFFSIRSKAWFRERLLGNDSFSTASSLGDVCSEAFPIVSYPQIRYNKPISGKRGTLMFEWFTEFMESPLGKLISTGILAVAVLLLTLAAAGLVNRLMKSWLTVTGKRTAVLRPS